jgi:hypothetical protein
MRQMQNWKSPFIAAAIFAALACLPLLGNLTFYMVKRATQKMVVLTRMSPDRMGPEAVDGKAHE